MAKLSVRVAGCLLTIKGRALWRDLSGTTSTSLLALAIALLTELRRCFLGAIRISPLNGAGKGGESHAETLRTQSPSKEDGKAALLFHVLKGELTYGVWPALNSELRVPAARDSDGVPSVAV